MLLAVSINILMFPFMAFNRIEPIKSSKVAPEAKLDVSANISLEPSQQKISADSVRTDNENTISSITPGLIDLEEPKHIRVRSKKRGPRKKVEQKAEE